MTHIDLHDSLTNKTGNSHSIDVDAYLYTCNEILDLDIHANQIMSWSNNSWSDD